MPRRPRNPVFRDGKVHVCSRLCDTCIFRRGSAISRARVAEMVRDATRAESTIVCHETLGPEAACCRGFFNRHATQPLQIAERLGFVVYVDPPGGRSHG